MIKQMCNMGGLLEKGQIVAIGPIDDILAQYHERNQQAMAGAGA
jgi:ABC-type polysaccharide/polyol phosphate transport system ATPase subunit